MSKIVCDICGTVYPDTAEECPVCGCTPELTAALLGESAKEAEPAAPAAVVEDTVRIETPAPVAPAPKAAKAPKVVVYEDDDDDDDDDFEDDDDDEEEEGHKSNALLVILLVIVILALLAVSAFIMVKYVAPNLLTPKDTEPETVQTTEAPVETTGLQVPCEHLALTSGGEIVLDAVGANWLINVLALPENTTDELIYTSSDEAVATVNEHGKITAVGEGTAVITIICGEQELKCTVTVAVPQETEAPATETTEPAEPEETTEPSEPETTAPDVVISFVKNDVTSRMIGEQFILRINPSDLDVTLLTWSSENEYIASVNENGLVTIRGWGTTNIVVTYGDQEIKCIVRVLK